MHLAEAREALQRIVRDGSRAGEIIARIRALFKKAETAKGPLDINEAIREVIGLARSEMEKKRITRQLRLAPDLPRVFGDRVQLQQVMLNLILNGVEAMSTVEGRSRELIVGTRAKEQAGSTRDGKRLRSRTRSPEYRAGFRGVPHDQAGWPRDGSFDQPFHRRESRWTPLGHSKRWSWSHISFHPSGAL